MANLFDVYNDGSIIDHTEGEKLETGETPITISGLTANTTYDKVQVAFVGSHSKSDVPSFNTKIGNNLIMLSSGLNTSSTSRPVLIGAISGANTNITYPSDGMLMTNTQPGEWYYQLAIAYTDITKTPLTAGQTYTLSLKAMGTAKQVALRWGSKEGSPGDGISYTNINNTTWTKVTITFTIPTGTLNMYLRINGAINNQYTAGFGGGETIKFKEVMLEGGQVANDWKPAPEDNAT